MYWCQQFQRGSKRIPPFPASISQAALKAVAVESESPERLAFAAMNPGSLRQPSLWWDPLIAHFLNRICSRASFYAQLADVLEQYSLKLGFYGVQARP